MRLFHLQSLSGLTTVRLKWRRASRSTITDGSSAVARPSDKFLKKVGNVLDKSEATFKGLWHYYYEKEKVSRSTQTQQIMLAIAYK